MAVNVKEMQAFLKWLDETCPFQHKVSSMQGGAFHVKFFLGEAEKPEGQFTLKALDKLTVEGDKNE
tara:strand:+ start:520 stop:717 length:198 start_codon:yes stop_codon:yes gene_type:complete